MCALHEGAQHLSVFHASKWRHSCKATKKTACIAHGAGTCWPALRRFEHCSRTSATAAPGSAPHCASERSCSLPREATASVPLRAMGSRGQGEHAHTESKAPEQQRARREAARHPPRPGHCAVFCRWSWQLNLVINQKFDVLQRFFGDVSPKRPSFDGCFRPNVVMPEQYFAHQAVLRQLARRHEPLNRCWPSEGRSRGPVGPGR